MLNPVGVEGRLASTTVSVVGVDQASPADMDKLKPPKRIYLPKTHNTKPFCGWFQEELRQAQKTDSVIGLIRAWMEANKERPIWVTVSLCSPATKTYWSQWKRLTSKMRNWLGGSNAWMTPSCISKLSCLVPIDLMSWGKCMKG